MLIIVFHSTANDFWLSSDVINQYRFTEYFSCTTNEWVSGKSRIKRKLWYSLVPSFKKWPVGILYEQTPPVSIMSDRSEIALSGLWPQR